MANRKVHYFNCENAASRRCRCGWCAGTMHGWKGAIDLAKSPNTAKLDDFAADSERRWSQESRKRESGKRNRPTYPLKAAVIDLVRTNILKLLAKSRSNSSINSYDRSIPGSAGSKVATQDPLKASEADSQRSGLDVRAETNDGQKEFWAPDDTTKDGMHLVFFGDQTEVPCISSAQSGHESLGIPVLDQVEQIGDDLFDHVLNDIASEYNGQIPAPIKIALADHFWCDLLANLAHAVDEGLRAVDKVSDQVVDAIIASRKENKWLPIERMIIRIAVNSLWRHICAAATSGLLGKGRAILPALRVLAILICKAPERHRAVIMYCIDPLEKQLWTATKKKLVEAFCDWLPHMRADLDNSAEKSS